MGNITDISETANTGKVAGASQGVQVISDWIGKATTKLTEIVSDFGFMEYAMIIIFVVLVIFLLRVNSQLKAIENKKRKKGPRNSLTGRR